MKKCERRKEMEQIGKEKKSYRKEGQRELIKTVSSKRERQPESLSGE
jgi:hypothetical protein